ncbi:MAG: hypothetical protein ABR907_09850 [Terracidiphilus sp.]|jgi:uncharacterized integral membrane protein
MAVDEDGWKEQLAFVSSYIVGFGFAVMKLWPFAAAFQTGISVNFWTANFPSEGVNTPLWVFWYLTGAVAMAVTAITLATVHIFSRGLWLAFFSGPSANPFMAGMSRALDRSRKISYGAAFFLLFYVVVFLVFGALILLSAGVENALTSFLSLSLKSAGWIARILVIVILLSIWAYFNIKYWPRIMRTLFDGRGQDAVSGVWAFIVAMLLFIVMWFIVIQNCFTAEVNLPGKVFQRSRGDLIEVELKLGGATSAVNVAQLKLMDTNGAQLKTLSAQDLGDGNYLGILQSRDLPEGRYELALEYPHSSFDSSFPFLHRRIVVQRWFLATPLS